MRSPEKTPPLLSRLPDVLSGILGPNLVGLYAYGSVFEQTFDPDRSDLDCLVVTEQALTDVDFGRLQEWFSEASIGDPWVERLQVSFLIRDTVFDEDPRCCLFQYGVLSRPGSDGNPLIWLDYIQRGRRLFGAAPESFLPQITGEMLREALVREIGYLRQEMCLSPDSEKRDKPYYRAYAVLTLCRILYSARTGRVLSKSRAGEWTLEHVSDEWSDLIRCALGQGDLGDMEGLPLRQIRGFIEFTQANVESLPLVSPPD